MLRTFRLIFLTLIAAVILFFGAGCAPNNPSPPLQRCEFTRLCMGVKSRIVVYAENADACRDAAAGAFDVIAHLDEVMSDYRHDSELMRLCDAAGGLAVPISRDLFDVLTESKRISDISGGAFDVTVGPCVTLWHEARRLHQLPNESDLNAARALVGSNYLIVDPQHQTAQLLKHGMKLDLGGIGKGFAARRAVDWLREQGFKRCLVALAGDIAMGDPPPHERGWRVAVMHVSDVSNGATTRRDGLPSDSQDAQRRVVPESPDAPAIAARPHDSPSTARSSQRPASRGTKDAHIAVSELTSQDVALLLSNCAVSTSGDTEQFIEIGGQRYSHIIDPHTGIGLTNQIACTIIAPRGELADALSTAVCVLGTQNATAFLAHFEHVAAIISEVGGDSQSTLFVIDRDGLKSDQSIASLR